MIILSHQDLRNHKADLEIRLDELQTARRDLMIELEELMKLLKVNNQMEPPAHIPQFYPPQRPPSATRMHGGPRVIVTPTGNTSRFDDITDVSGLGIDRPSSRTFGNQDPAVIAD